MAKRKKVLILGVTGQDGAYLAKQMLETGWVVYGGYRRGSSTGLWRLIELDVLDKISLVDINVTDSFSTVKALREIKPDQIYHLAGASFVADSFNIPSQIIEANTFAAINVLNAMTLEKPDARFFFAASSEIFGRKIHGTRVNEDEVAKPLNPYGVSKLATMHLVSIYRERYGLFASSGILFNHESPLRARNFVTRKIAYNIARLKLCGGEPMILGNLDNERDWGCAADYTKAMQLIVSTDQPDDFVVATGRLNSVRKFLKQAASSAGFEPEFEGNGISEICFDKVSGRELAKISEKYFRPLDTPPLRGDASKLKSCTGWEAQTSLLDLASAMVEADIDRVKKGNISA